MVNTRLLRMLNSLTPVEFNDFGEYIHSPYFNRSEKLINLYEYLKTFYPDFNSKEINKQKLFDIMYPGEKYNDKKLRERFSLMVRLTERYAAYLEFRRDTFENQFYLIKHLSKRNIGDIFSSKLESLVEFLGKSKAGVEDLYLKKYFIEKLKREHNERMTQAGKLKPVYDNFVNENNELFTFFLITFLMNYLKLKETEGLIKITEQSKIFESTIDYIGKVYDHFSEIPAVQILYKLLKLYSGKKEDKKAYKEIQDLLSKNPGIFKTDDLRMLYSILYDYCKDMQEKGEKDFGKESFEILKKMVEENLHLENDGFIHPHNYINFAATATRVNELQWAEDFIDKYADKIRPEFRDNAFNYNSASLNYIKGRRDRNNKRKYFELALSHLAKVRKEDFYYYSRIKNTEIRIYYELNETERCRSIIDSYSKSINKSDLIPENVKERYNNFIQFTYRLICLKDNMYRNKKMSDEKNLLRTEMSNSNIEFKQWLLEKLEEISF